MKENEQENVVILRREETKQEALELLNKTGRACIVRPTGFGKTVALAEVAKTYLDKGEKVLYLYPQDTVKQSALRYMGLCEEDLNDKGEWNNLKFMTYHKLARITDFSAYRDYSLAITDECHKIGGEKTSEAMNLLSREIPGIKILGATATPDRPDLKDVIGDYFDDNVVSEYTLHDAFKEGILHRPYYCFCTYTTEDKDEVEKKARAEMEGLDPAEKEEQEKLLSARLIEISNLLNIGNVIRDTCDQYARSAVEGKPNTSYMKFIVFFSDFAHIRFKGADVENWFKDAYPDHDINILTITSESAETHNNIEKLSSMVPKENVIDLIFCVDMMNMGYHTSDLTGIVMYRGTASPIVFAQQLGRVLSSGDVSGGIVFDLVDNLHRESLYEVLGHKSAATIKRKFRWEELSAKRERALALAPEYNDDDVTLDRNDEGKSESVLPTVTEDDEQTTETQKKETTQPVPYLDFDPNTGEELTEGLTKAEYREWKNFEQRYNPEKWWYHERVSELEPEDLIATGHEAAYRELIRKTTAEPFSMRCRQAYALWLEKGGSADPLTREHILSQGIRGKRNTGVPLEAFCRLKNVSVEAVLSSLGI